MITTEQIKADTNFTSYISTGQIKLGHLNAEEREVASGYLQVMKDRGFNPHKIGISPHTKTIDSELAAYKATHAQFGFEGSIQSQVRQIYKLMRIRVRSAINYWTQYRWQELYYDDRNCITGEAVIKQLLKVIQCRPAGGRFTIDFDNQDRNNKYRCDAVCGLYKICPWCFYRKFCELHESLLELDTRVPANSMWTISEAFLKGGRAVHLVVNKKLRDWLNRTKGYREYCMLQVASGNSLLSSKTTNNGRIYEASIRLVLIAPSGLSLWDWPGIHKLEMARLPSGKGYTNTMNNVANTMLPIAYSFPYVLYKYGSPEIIGEFIRRTYMTHVVTTRGIE